ncbi:MAG: helix-turn-helix domain-containing protein, partial [Dokdonella sp.]
MSTRRSRGQTLGQLHALRTEAVRLHLQGVRVMQIVAQTGLSWPSVRRAIDQYMAGGDAALVPASRGKQRGDGRHLDAAQELAIRTTICAYRPDTIGLDSALWDRATVERLIERETGSMLSTRAVGNYLRRWSFTLEQPRKPAA